LGFLTTTGQCKLRQTHRGKRRLADFSAPTAA
jgi:hypothetical protein